MVLSFKEKFIPLILDGKKIHTLRTDSFDRWGVGASIHFSTGAGTSHKEHLCKECVSTQRIEIYWEINKEKLEKPKILIDRRLITEQEIDLLAKNDGFDSTEEFLSWDAWNKKAFIGKIIHWTDKKY